MIFCATPAETPLSCIKSVLDASLMLISETMTLTRPGLCRGLASAVASELGGLASTPDAPTARHQSNIPSAPPHRAVFIGSPLEKDELMNTIRLLRDTRINAQNQIRKSVSKERRPPATAVLRSSRRPPCLGATRTR